MSSSVKKNTITLTRGDTLRVKIDLLKDDEPYYPVEGDTIRFALKNVNKTADGTEYVDQEPLILKTVPIDTMILQLDPEDTKPLGFKTYIYDLEITFADGTVDTFVTEATFNLTGEVH